MLARLMKALQGGSNKQIESMGGVAKRLLQNPAASDAHLATAEKLKELMLLKGCLIEANYCIQRWRRQTMLLNI